MKKLLLLFIATLGFSALLQAQTDVLHIKSTGMLIDYENNSTHDASALLQLGSDNTSTQGFLAPRVALTAANVATPITTPATGLLIFNTTTANTGAAAPPNDITPGYYYNAGSSVAPQWVRLITGGTANAWTLTGNTGTTASTAAIGATVNNNFIGTTDTKDFVMATNNLERMRITSNGNVGIGIIAPTSKLYLNHGFTSAGASEAAAFINTSNTATITADRIIRGLQVQALNRQTENGFNGSGFGIDGLAYTDGSHTFNWLRGGNFSAYSTSTSATDQDAIAGILSSGYNNGTGTVTSVYGAYNQGYNNGTGTSANVHGAYNLGFVHTNAGTITNLYGSRNYAFKNSNSAGNVGTAYGTYSQVSNIYDNPAGAITTGYAYYGILTKATNATDFTTTYGMRLDVSTGTTRWGIYTENEHKNYFSGNVGIAATSPVSRLDLGSALNTNKPLLRFNPGAATAVSYAGYAHNDFLLGGYVTGGYSEHYISFGHTADPLRKFHIGSASNVAFDGTTTFVPAVTVMSGGNVGIGTTNPVTKLMVGSDIAHDNAFNYTDARLAIFENTNNNGGDVPNGTRDILHLVREGISSQAYGNKASFALGRYEDVGTNSRTQLDIKLTDAAYNSHNTIMTMLSSGNVGIGSTNPQAKLHVEAGKIYGSKTTFPNPTSYSDADLVLGSNTDTRNGYGQTNGSHIFLRSSAKSTITALDESQNLGQISYENLVWTIGESAGVWGPQQVRLPGGSPGAGKVLVSSDATGLASWVAPGSIGAGDNLGNHTATTALNMNGNNINAAATITSTGNHYINNASPTIFFQDTDNETGMIHMNSNLMYFLSGSGNNTASWTVNGSEWPLTINMIDDRSNFGGTVDIKEGDFNIDGVKPILIRRYSSANFGDNDNVDWSTGISDVTYSCVLGGFNGSDGNDIEGVRAYMYRSGGAWRVRLDLHGEDENGWDNVDVVCYKREMVDDNR